MLTKTFKLQTDLSKEEVLSRLSKNLRQKNSFFVPFSDTISNTALSIYYGKVQDDSFRMWRYSSMGICPTISGNVLSQKKGSIIESKVYYKQTIFLVPIAFIIIESALNKIIPLPIKAFVFLAYIPIVIALCILYWRTPINFPLKRKEQYPSDINDSSAGKVNLLFKKPPYSLSESQRAIDFLCNWLDATFIEPEMN